MASIVPLEVPLHRPSILPVAPFGVRKILRFNRQRANISLDLFNALSADAVLTYNQAFTPGGAWLVPTSVLTARTAKITVQYDF